MPRKSGGIRTPCRKALERRAKKAEKRSIKNEQKFASAIQSSKASLVESDHQFVLSTLEDNPKWIQPLAGLIRSGCLNGILKEHTFEGPELVGPRWKGRARKWLDIPVDMQLTMIEATGVKKPDKSSDQPEFVPRCFMSQFWVGQKAPIPQRSDIRLVSTLEKLARARVKELNLNYLDKFKDGMDNLLKDPNEMAVWELEGNKLVLRGLAQNPEDYKEHELAAAPKGQSWHLSDPFSPDCHLTTDKKSSMWDFLALDLLNEDQDQDEYILDPNRKWAEDGLEAEHFDETRSEYSLLTATGAPSEMETPAKRPKFETLEHTSKNKTKQEGEKKTE